LGKGVWKRGVAFLCAIKIFTIPTQLGIFAFVRKFDQNFKHSHHLKPFLGIVWMSE
jgi:hypothetical protein